MRKVPTCVCRGAKPTLTRMTSVAPPSAPTTVTAMAQFVLRLTSGTTPIRGMVIPVKGHQFSVYDFMYNTGAYSTKNAVKVAFCRMISEGSF